MRIQVLRGILFVLFSVSSSFGVAQGASSESDQTLIIEKKQSIRGYQKRDRYLESSSTKVSPAQMHEILGTRGSLGISYFNMISNQSSDKKYANLTSYNASAIYGVESLTFGIDLKTAEGKSFSSLNENWSEEYSIGSVIPEVAFTISRNYTVGATFESSELNFNQSSDSTKYNSASLNLSRPSIGLSKHAESYEFGIVYKASASDSSPYRSREQSPSFSLATDYEEYKSAYSPSEVSLYARANLQDYFSVFGRIGMSAYDGNHEGAIGLYNKYELEDRLSFAVHAVIWSPQRTRYSLEAKYLGGATVHDSTAQYLGYKFSNQYGITVASATRVLTGTYLGLSVTTLQGNKDKTIEGVHYFASERDLSVSSSITHEL